KIALQNFSIKTLIINISEEKIIDSYFEVDNDELLESVVITGYGVKKDDSFLNIEEIIKNSILNDKYNIYLKDDNLYVIRSGVNQRLGKNPLAFFDFEIEDFEELTTKKLQEHFEDDDLP